MLIFMSNDDVFTSAISRYVWDSKYRYRDDGTVRDASIQDTWRRVARALAEAEAADCDRWEARFYRLLEGFRFLPAGRILAGAGTGRRVTLFNCFVMGVVEDSMDGIFDALKEGALTMQQGGGVGYDFSTLRPSGTPARTVGGIASGPVSFMRIWDSMCGTLLSTGARRGAMMATLRCDHPDIERFIDAKRDERELRNFNLSVQVTDDFVRAVRADDAWPLVFPLAGLDAEESGNAGEIVMRRWPGTAGAVACRVLRVVRARPLWDRLMRATYDYAEPGVLFVDTINRLNNLGYREHISATNPCGEIPLPPYGACNLGSLNLTRFVDRPFSEAARLDLEALAEAVRVAVRMLDNVIDVSQFPLQKQAAQARGSRRIGLGITGLADALMMLGIRYGEDRSFQLAASVMQTLCHTAYRTSAALATEKGPFPFFEPDKFLQGEFVRGLPADIQDTIRRCGLRNSHLTAIAPTGTISLLANNVSSGLEPAFDCQYTRRVRQADGSYADFELLDYACACWREREPGSAAPAAFVAARNLGWAEHLRMQAAVQPYVDNAISKTINVPADLGFPAFKAVYEKAHALGLKGCTTFRPNPVTGAVLAANEPAAGSHHCCSIEREAD
jgi:ribonucleoside-diphosphate reductase alpha chain